MTPEEVINKAREYIGVPFHHGGRSRKGGVDCGGLLVCVAADLGIEYVDRLNYSQINAMQDLILGIESVANLQPDADMSTWNLADIIIFRGRMVNAHTGLYSGNGKLINAYAGTTNRVVENDISDYWLSRIFRRYRLKVLL